MSDVGDTLTMLQNKDNPRRNFLRKVLGVDNFDGTVVNNFRSSDANKVSPEKTVSIKINEGRCTACGQCALFCLPNALSLTERNGSFSLRYYAAKCIDCHICSQVCPEGALKLDALLQARSGSVEEKEVAAGGLSSCVDCHAPVATVVGFRRCFVCRQRPRSPEYLAVP